MSRNSNAATHHITPPSPCAKDRSEVQSVTDVRYCTGGTASLATKHACVCEVAQLGHSHMAPTLEVYTHASRRARREAVNMLNQADQPSRRNVVVFAPHFFVSSSAAGPSGVSPGGPATRSYQIAKCRAADASCRRDRNTESSVSAFSRFRCLLNAVGRGFEALLNHKGHLRGALRLA